METIFYIPVQIKNLAVIDREVILNPRQTGISADANNWLGRSFTDYMEYLYIYIYAHIVSNYNLESNMVIKM